jgi:hypothetical protein
MDSYNSLQASFWVMVMLQTIGSVDMPGRGPRKMPAPRNYVAIIVTWGVLQLIADMREGAARAATAIAWVIVLAGMVLGPFGSTLTSAINTISTTYGAPPSAGTDTTTQTG